MRAGRRATDPPKGTAGLPKQMMKNDHIGIEGKQSPCWRGMGFYILISEIENDDVWRSNEK